MSILSDKILSYSPEQYIRFNTAYSLSPTNLGSGGTGAWSLTNEAPVLNATGGPDGEGAWQFNIGGNSDTSPTRFQITTASNVALTPEFTDGSFSTGFWFRFTQQLDAVIVSTYPLFRITTKSMLSQISVDISSDTSRRGRLTSSVNAGGLNTLLQPRRDDGNWHYVAIRINETSSGIFDGECYIDGVLSSSYSGRSVTVGSITTLVLGNFTTGSVAGPVGVLEFANFYVAPYETINPTAIAEIYTAGTTVPTTTNITITETPATASAFMTEPTIIIVANNNTQITTSFLASANIPGNIVAGGDRNVNIVVTEVLTASADMVNNVEVDTGTDSLYVATEMTASAELLDSHVSEAPMTAIATMPNAVATIPPNYFNLVNQLSPYFYINNGLAVPINYGTQAGTLVRGSDLRTNQDGGNPMNLVGSGKSWQGVSTSNSNGFFTFETANFADSFNNLLGTGTFAYEVWVKPNALPETTIHSNTGVSYSILNSEKLSLNLEDYYREAIYVGGLLVGYDVYPRYFSLNINNNLNNKIELTANIDSSSFSLGNWNHIVINVYQSGIDANQRLAQLWVNGQVVINQNIAFTTWSDTTDKVNFILGSDANSLTLLSDMYYDELAIYESPLTNSQIIQHNQFISSISPNYTNFTEEFIASAEFGDHNFVVNSNANVSESIATASGVFVKPAVIAQKTINVATDPATASALNTDVTVFYGRTFIATPMIVAAESKEGFFLSEVYSNYVRTNIAPYRYVTFDGENEYLDYGTDNDYSVAPTIVGGTIVSPEFGINGKSAKTAGTSYITNGVILKESEWNDSWGTGQNSYHSAFWFQRAADDNSTTGLRVLWNLNGYKDNQHVVLYQYLGRLHMQFNNGSGTFVEQDTTALDLFDYNRHFVVIEFDHTNNNNNIVRLYVDAVLKSTINLGAYTGSTTNAVTADSGPNNELNNHPRLSVGCLITPFASTALPVVPTNTKLIIDEVYWDKQSITSTMVTNLFNVMPDKTNKTFIAEAMTATTLFAMPAFSTSSVLVTSPLTASVEAIEPVTTADREVIAQGQTMTADAQLPQPVIFEDKLILADILVATATFNNAGALITIPGPTMTAKVKLQSSALSLNVEGQIVYPNLTLSPWITYLRATETNKILPLREVV